MQTNLDAVRKIYEVSNEQLKLNTEQEMKEIQLIYNRSDIINIKNNIDKLLSKNQIDIKCILGILNQDNYRTDIMINNNIRIIKGLIEHKQFMSSNFYKVNSIDEMYMLYQKIKFILKRIEFGTIAHSNDYIKEFLVENDLLPEDILIVLEVQDSLDC